MPNWCENRLEVQGDEKEVHGWVEQASSLRGPDVDPQPIHFAAFVSQPDDLPDTEIIDWRYNNWGTKWEPEFFSMDRLQGGATYYFETPWGPPLVWIEQVSRQYPALEFRLVYAEPGMDFSGDVVIKSGRVLRETEGCYGECAP